MTYLEILNKHTKLMKRKTKTIEKYNQVKDKLNSIDNEKIVIYAVGSIGRDELGDKSDLDLFYISKNEIDKLEENKIFDMSKQFNKELGFEEFSNNGQFLKIHLLDIMKKTIGDPKDDEENLFTARMLLLLESKVLLNEPLYDEIISIIIEVYFRDYKEDGEFKPLFILNDLLRFWRTLCLNYENTRHTADRLYRKKNINLKYSRMITVFSTVLCIITTKNINKNEMISICKKSPFERFSMGLDNLGKSTYKKNIRNFLTCIITF